MTEDEIRAWHLRHRMEYIPEDWGPRSSTGESAGPGPRTGPDTVVDPTESWWWDDNGPLWEGRSYHDAEYARSLEEFFDPYLALLNRPQGNLLRQVINDRLSYAEMSRQGEAHSRQAAWKGVRGAVRKLTHLIALDDPGFEPEADGRRRDYDKEQASALRVLKLYLSARAECEPQHP